MNQSQAIMESLGEAETYFVQVWEKSGKAHFVTSAPDRPGLGWVTDDAEKPMSMKKAQVIKAAKYFRDIDYKVHVSKGSPYSLPIRDEDGNANWYPGMTKLLK